MLFKLASPSSSCSAAAASSNGPIEALSAYSRKHRLAVHPDSFSLLHALKSCAAFRSPAASAHLHSHILKLGFSVHVYVATALLNAYAVCSPRDAGKLFDEMPNRNTVTWNTMITCHGRSTDLMGARKVFEEMPVRDVASWSAIVAAYVNNGKWADGLGLFRRMMTGTASLKPDQVTVGSVLSGCSHMGSLGLLFGRSIHSFVVKNGWEVNVVIGTHLIDMYSKCGLLMYALRLFNLLEERNVMTWTAMICGSAQNGHAAEALALFEMMRQTGVRPNELTFTGVLSACANTGLVEEGRRYFKMLGECGVKPRIQHYGCMVDLFGKAGFLEEAYQTIQMMEFEPNIVIWSSYLSACKTHKQFEMAEQVIDRVLRMVRPENDGGVYTLISDIYVLSNKWDEAERIRKIMLQQSTRKIRGSSFIKSWR